MSNVTMSARKAWVGFMILALCVDSAIGSQAWHFLALIPLGILAFIIAKSYDVLRQPPPSQQQRFDNPEMQTLHEDIMSGKVKAGSEEMFQRMMLCGDPNVTQIGEVSEKVVGTFNGHTMYEWVEIMNPISKKMEVFDYHSPGSYLLDGSPIIPEDNDLSFAHVNGVVYSRKS